MGEVLFYHLSTTPLDASLPEMLERARARGWRVLLRSGTADELARLDALLWSYRDDAFLPHGTRDMGHDADQPVYLTCGDENPNGATVLMLVDGARAHPDEMAAMSRTCLIFDGTDPDALEAARTAWREVKASGLPAKYWAQDGGRWADKSAS